MQELIKNWIGFFRRAHVPEDVVAKVFAFLSKYSPGSLISRLDFLTSVTAKEREAVEIIEGLEQSGLVAIDFKCPNCSFQLPKATVLSADSVINCPSCDTELPARSLNCIKVLEYAVSQAELNKALFFEGYDNDANEFITAGGKQGYIFYLITDIEGSQALQRSDPDNYSNYLRFLQQKAWPNSIRKALRRRLLMFGRGDCIVYAFIDVEDAVNVLLSLKEQISSLPELRLSAHLIRLSIAPTDRKHFMLNMEGKWDFNVPAVTDAFRISTIKPKVWENLDKSKYKIKFAIVGEANTALKSRGITSLAGMEDEISGLPKHGIEYREKCLAGGI